MQRQALSILLLCSSLVYGQVAPGSEAASSHPSTAPASLPKTESRADLDLYVKVRLDRTVKLSALKPGDVVDGALSRPVYSGERELFPEGARVRLTVDELARRRRVPNDHWPWVVKVFTPRYENYPTFQSATVALPDAQIALRVSLVSIADEVQVPAKPEPTNAGKKIAVPTLTLQAAIAESTMADSGGDVAPLAPGVATLLAGTQARIVLLGSVSASRSRPGDSFQARLTEPVRIDSRVVLPEGTLFEGIVVNRTRPRWLSRSGSLLLTFTQVTLPGGTPTPVVASVSGVRLDQRSHTRIDSEGNLRGDRPGKLWALIHVGVATGLAKAADDATQLLVEAIASAATDASTAGTARIAALCVSGIFLATRHGRDVVLPRFSEMDITFDRPASGSAPAAGEKPSLN